MTDLLEPFRSTTAWWTIAVGAATNVACALVGCYLVLRRMSLMGDALAHAVLPGLVLAFIFSGSLNIVPLFLGAVTVGMLATFLIQSLHQYGRVPADASMGVIFTSMFALGVVLVKQYVSGVHFDAACVYEGQLELVAVSTVDVAGLDVPRTLLTIGPVLLINILVIALFWKELKLSSFDANLATAIGFSATAMHYMLMVLVAVTTVASFEAVGSILVVAMLIVPAATAHLLCDRLASMIAMACLVGVLSAVGGYWMAHVCGVNAAGSMTVAAGAFYGLAVLFSPRYGMISTMVRNLQTSLRVTCEDILAMLYKIEEAGTLHRLDTSSAVQALGGGPVSHWGISAVVRRGHVRRTEQGLELTEAGRAAAMPLIRSHRLWEAYLVQHLGLPLDHIHEPAHRVEHFIDEKLRHNLEEAVDDAGRDPHGRDIPDE